jgi:phospholipid N-methyltransferase
MTDAMLFAGIFLKNPAMLGSVWPSSDRLCSHLIGLADWNETRHVVEYGPGVGTITRHILGQLRSDGTLIAIEKNPELVEYLRERFRCDDPRLKIVHGSAADVRKILIHHRIATADCIVAGIPFSLLPPRQVQRILWRTRQSLSPRGRLLVYQFSDAIEPVLKRYFQLLHSGRVMRNFLPARTYVAVTPEGGIRYPKQLRPPGRITASQRCGFSCQTRSQIAAYYRAALMQGDSI